MAAASLSDFLSLLTVSSHPKPSLTTPSLSYRTANAVDLSPIAASSGVSAAVHPAAAHANLLFFKSAYNVMVIVDENEHEEKLINRFRKAVLTARVIQESKRRMYFENPREASKRKAREAAKRNRRPRYFKSKNDLDKQEANRNKRDEDDGDNWELSDVDPPAHDYLSHLNETSNRWDYDEKGSSSNTHLHTPTVPSLYSGRKKKEKSGKMN